MTSHSATHGTSRETVFDVDVEKLARIYALAVLDAAGADENTVMDELRSLVDEVLNPYREIEQVFGSALVGMDEKLGIIERLLAGKVSATTLNFLKVLTRHGRLGQLRQVVRSAGQMWQQRNGRVPMHVELAQVIDPGLLQEIINGLSAKLGVEAVVTTSVNPDLLGGFVARVGDRVYDASTRSSLERVRQSIVSRAIDAIQASPEKFMDQTTSA